MTRAPTIQEVLHWDGKRENCANNEGEFLLFVELIKFQKKN
jgi:hypothetical protein